MIHVPMTKLYGYEDPALPKGMDTHWKTARDLDRAGGPR
jgi:hypothetical protein